MVVYVLHILLLVLLFACSGSTSNSIVPPPPNLLTIGNTAPILYVASATNDNITGQIAIIVANDSPLPITIGPTSSAYIDNNFAAVDLYTCAGTTLQPHERCSVIVKLQLPSGFNKNLSMLLKIPVANGVYQATNVDVYAVASTDQVIVGQPLSGIMTNNIGSAYATVYIFNGSSQSVTFSDPAILIDNSRWHVLPSDSACHAGGGIAPYSGCYVMLAYNTAVTKSTGSIVSISNAIINLNGIRKPQLQLIVYDGSTASSQINLPKHIQLTIGGTAVNLINSGMLPITKINANIIGNVTPDLSDCLANLPLAPNSEGSCKLVLNSQGFIDKATLNLQYFDGSGLSTNLHEAKADLSSMSLYVTPSNLSFAAQPSSTQTQYIVVTNLGADSLQYQSVGLDTHAGDFVFDDSACKALGALVSGGQCSITINYQPHSLYSIMTGLITINTISDSGSVLGNVNITYRSDQSQSMQFCLTDDCASPKQSIDINVTNLATKQQTIFIKNIGQRSIIPSPVLQNPPSTLQLSSNNCNVDLPPGQVCNVVLQYKPVSASETGIVTLLTSSAADMLSINYSSAPDPVSFVICDSPNGDISNDCVPPSQLLGVLKNNNKLDAVSLSLYVKNTSEHSVTLTGINVSSRLLDLTASINGNTCPLAPNGNNSCVLNFRLLPKSFFDIQDNVSISFRNLSHDDLFKMPIRITSGTNSNAIYLVNNTDSNINFDPGPDETILSYGSFSTTGTAIHVPHGGSVYLSTGSLGNNPELYAAFTWDQDSQPQTIYHYFASKNMTTIGKGSPLFNPLVIEFTEFVDKFADNKKHLYVILSNGSDFSQSKLKTILVSSSSDYHSFSDYQTSLSRDPCSCNSIADM